jgi:hypothetical protein
VEVSGYDGVGDGDDDLNGLVKKRVGEDGGRVYSEKEMREIVRDEILSYSKERIKHVKEDNIDGKAKKIPSKSEDGAKVEAGGLEKSELAERIMGDPAEAEKLAEKLVRDSGLTDPAQV